MNIDLSRAYSYSRQKRAKKAVSILREQLEKRGEDASISSELNNHIWSQGAESPPKTVEVEVRDGMVYPASSGESDVETSGEEDSVGESGEMSEALDGTVSDAKEAIKEMEDPDYDKLLEIEREGKDRKTLKEWLESR